MAFYKSANLGKLALIVSLGALCACESIKSGPRALNAAAIDEETGEGVYFPAISSFETPDIRFAQLAGVGPQQRLFFADQVNLAASTPGRTVPIVAQAVGQNGETLVLMYVSAEGPMTTYLARGVLARLTSVARLTPAIADMGLSSEFDIYNMAAVLGFERVVVTDGREFAHEADLQSN